MRLSLHSCIPRTIQNLSHFTVWSQSHSSKFHLFRQKWQDPLHNSQQHCLIAHLWRKLPGQFDCWHVQALLHSSLPHQNVVTGRLSIKRLLAGRLLQAVTHGHARWTQKRLDGTWYRAWGGDTRTRAGLGGNGVAVLGPCSSVVALQPMVVCMERNQQAKRW